MAVANPTPPLEATGEREFETECKAAARRITTGSQMTLGSLTDPRGSLTTSFIAIFLEKLRTRKEIHFEIADSSFDPVRQRFPNCAPRSLHKCAAKLHN